MQTVIWKPIPGFHGYEASDLGEIRRSDGRLVPTRLQAAHKTSAGGYLIADVHQDGIKKTRRVHRLVALAFHGPIPRGHEVCHNNGNKTDNRPENLRYGTRSENIKDQVKHGTHYEATRTHCPRNHPYTRENTRIYDGKRSCIRCSRMRSRGLL